MKLKRLEKLRKNKKKIILGTIAMLCSLGIGLLLGKTFSMYQVNNETNDTYFSFYNGTTWLEEMPQKGNEDNLVFDNAICDDGSEIEWDNTAWAPRITNLTKAKTRCILYFKEKTNPKFPGREIPLAEAGTDGLYEVEHNTLSEIDSSWSKTEYRYAGVDPDNYVSFNNEIWRIIGLVNVQTTTDGRVEQRLKIVRANGISGQKDFYEYAWDNSTSDYTSNWTTSKLKDMLNGIYYNSDKGTCYRSSQSECDFSGSSYSFPKGLDDTAKNMIDSEVIWNIGGWKSATETTTDTSYEKERGTTTPNSYPNVWTTANDPTYHKGIGLMYPSDYGYAVGGNVRNTCLKSYLMDYDSNSCSTNNWLKASSGYQWLLSSVDSSNALYIYSGGYVYTYKANRTADVWPVGYLTSSVTISDGDGSFEKPFILSQN